MPEVIVKLGDNIIQKYFFVNETMNIGRSPDNEIVIENLAVSRQHACITYEDGRYLVNDLGSSNGTFVNGIKSKQIELKDKDVIAIGKHQLYFYDQTQKAPEHPVSMADVDKTMMMDNAPPMIATLEVLKGKQKGETYDLTQAVTNLGRGSANDVILSDWFVSKMHAAVEHQNDIYTVRDLGSWRHTMVNGEKIDGPMGLKDGDLIQLGPTVVLKFKLEALTPQPAAAVPQRLEIKAMDMMDDMVPAAAEPAEPAQPVLVDEEAPDFEAEQEEQQTDQPWTEAPYQEPPAPQEAYSAPDYTEGLFTAPPAQPELVDEEQEPGPQWDVELNAAEPPQEEAQPQWPSEEIVNEELAPEGLGEDNKGPELSTEQEQEIAMWEKALANKSQAIRKQAARRLKQITGKDYEY